MKEILKSITKRTLFNILIFLQVLFSILYFFITTISMQAVVNSNISAKNELDSNPKRTLHMEIQNEDSKNFSKFKEELLNANLVDGLTGWRNSDLTPDTHVIGEKGDSFDNVQLAKGSEKLKKINVATGRYFTDADFKKENATGSKSKPFSMILGSEFANNQNLKVGDSYHDVNDKYYKVVGILEPNSKWFRQTVSEGNIMVMDNAVMVAYVNDPENPLMHYYSILNDNVNSDDAIYKINKIAKKYNIVVEAKTISKELNETYSESVSQDISWVIFSLIILVFVTIGTSILIVSHMYMRKNEIGIRMACGYSFKKVLLLLWGEFLVVSILAFLSALLIAYISYSGGKEIMFSAYYFSSFHLSYGIVLIGIGVFLLMCIPSLLVLVFKLRKVQPKDLIGGK
ncbi:MAG: ABC transporter permease [Ruminococcus sp.]|nr:ABC transporter permease [Ruminococcus sp.]MEE0006173.1 ABC transporter permease [Ruminococcus sp.]